MSKTIPLGELPSHQVRLCVVQSVLAAEFEPVLHGILDRNAFAHDLAFSQRLHQLKKPLMTAQWTDRLVEYHVRNGSEMWNLMALSQFAIKYNKREVVPPTKKQIQKVLAAAAGRIKLLCQLMRETGMALVDAQKFDPEKLEDGTLIRGNRSKTHERFRVRISSSLAKQLEALGCPAFPGTYREWRERCYKTFKDAGVKMTPHGFRHFRISEWLAQGGSVAMRTVAVASWARAVVNPLHLCGGK